jgi:hypothetical protein
MSAACTPESFASDGRIPQAALSWFAGAALIVLATACSSPDATVETVETHRSRTCWI